MNIMEYLFLLFLGKAEDIWRKIEMDGIDAVKKKYDRVKRLLILAVAVPGLLLAVGIAIGALGAPGAAQGFIRIGGLIASILMVIIWVRAWAYANVILAASYVASAVTDNVPEIDSAQVRSLVRWLRGITVLISIACLYAMVVPIWNHLGWSAVAAVCMLALAGVMSAGWFSGRLGQYASFAISLAILLFSTVMQFSPAVSQAVSAIAEENFGRLNGWGERKEKMSAASQAADKEADTADQQLLTQKLAERNLIRKRAIELCGGNICEQDRAKVATLEQEVGDLKDGTYWSKRKGNASPNATVQSAPDATVASNTAELPPPPAVRRKKDPPPAAPPPADGGLVSAGTQNAKAKEEICATYPYICE